MRFAGYRRSTLFLAVCAGVGLGIAGFTFHYAEGASYLSTDPRACVNCHIMDPQYDSWQKSSHHSVAACVDCHLPPSGLEKWIAKASNGYHHSKAFTLQDFDEPIRIKANNAAILQSNCVRCHADLLHDQSVGQAAPDCIHCHRRVGHGETLGLGGAEHETHKQ